MKRLKMLTHQQHNQAIRIQMQEVVAIQLESFFPDKKIISYKTNGADVVIYDQMMNTLAKCEVKSAKEVFYHKYNHTIRRGMFSIKPQQLDADFWAFVVRFVDQKLIWNGEIEIWWAMNQNVKEYLQQQPLYWINYKLNINKLVRIGATLNFVDIKNQLF